MTTTMEWVTIDAGASAEAVAGLVTDDGADAAAELAPDQVSGAVRALTTSAPGLVTERAQLGYTTHHFLGLGFTLIVMLGVAVVAVLLALVRRASLWLLVGAFVAALAAAIGGGLLALVAVVDSAYEWILPDRIESYSPEIRIEPWGMAYVAAASLLSLVAIHAWLRAKGGWKVSS
ncbi:MAG: hypothetical protein AAGD35_11090 [Actinomycetota bacterium]